MSLNADLKFDTPKHKKLADHLWGMYKMSRAKMSQRFKVWEDAENQYHAYIKETDDDAARRVRRESKGKPQYTTIFIPYSYATLLTAHTYWSAVFLGRSPVLQLTARHGEGTMRVQAMEAILDYQLMVGEQLAPLYVWLLDIGKYGLGIVGSYWDKETITVRQIVEEPMEVFGIPIPGKSRRVQKVMEEVGYAGNRLYNIRPYDFLPDPRVSFANIQAGEFCGHLTYLGWTQILKNRGDYINIDELEKRWTTQAEREPGSPREELPYVDNTEAPEFSLKLDRRAQMVEAVELVWDLVPSDWDLGEGNRPEKWAFSLAAKDVIIRARPIGEFHNKFPYHVMTYEVNGYGHNVRGMMEVLKPLNDTITWLYNTHFFNTRKALNDQLVVDPSRLVLKDLLDGGPGRIIRLAPHAYGQDVRTILQQLQVGDVTRQHIEDSTVVADMMQRVSGVSDNLMGLLDPGGRKTATEVRTSSSFGVNRLKTVAEYNSALAWGPMAQVLVQRTQQHLDVTRKYKIARDLMMGDPAYLEVSPKDIPGFYDLVPVDGTMPVDRFAQATLWKEVLAQLSQVPQIAMSYDLGAIFAWMAQLAGLKNITQFRLQAAPPEALAAQAAAGNVIPMPRGGTQGGPTGTVVGSALPRP